MALDILRDAPLPRPGREPGAEPRPASPEEPPLVTHPSWSSALAASWLVERGGQGDLGGFFGELCQQLLAEGLPLTRARLGHRTMHPEIFARSFEWRIGANAVAAVERDYSMRTSPVYLNSPVRLIHQGAAAYRQRLEGQAEALEFPVLREFKADGHSDYLMLGLPQSDGVVNFISFLADRPGGFTTAELTLLHDLLPLIALRVELHAAHEATRTLLTTYLGREPARRVLAGAVRRNQVESIRAAVWFSDLRGFTGLSDQLPAAEVIGLLDEYFELVGGPIEQRGGEVLKFLGDGVLGMFDASHDEVRACATALTTALAVEQGLARANARRRAEGQPLIRCATGLHLGDVQFGNIGSRERLDFTVVGPAVNEASRVLNLAKALDRPVLATAAFAARAPHRRLESLGVHALRGVAEPQEIFALTEMEPVG